MSKSNVSVVIPMFNSSKTILNTLLSVKNQSLKPLEVIVVDDGSNDSSVNLVENFRNTNLELNITLICKENGGVSSARNKGMKIAKGEWIALLDSDDEWLQNKLARQFEIIENNNQIDFLATMRNEEKISQILWKRFSHLTRIGPKLLLIKFVFVVPTVILKTKILSDIGYFDENQKYAEEGNFFIRISQKYNCYLLNESLVITGNWKQHFGQSGLSGNLMDMEIGELKNISDAYNMKIINVLEFAFLNIFSILKFLRRLIIVKIRQYV